MLKSLALERLYRDSRCGSLMLPWTAELCVDKLGREALYEKGEVDELILFQNGLRNMQILFRIRLRSILKDGQSLIVIFL